MPSADRLNVRELASSGAASGRARSTSRSRRASASNGGAGTVESGGLRIVIDLPVEAMQDPMVAGTGFENVGRDGCRVPLPWTPTGSSFGFGPDGGAAPWLPQPSDWGTWSAADAVADPTSALHLYRAALGLRAELPALGDGDLNWVDAGPTALAFTREPGFGCWVNLGDGLDGAHAPVAV